MTRLHPRLLSTCDLDALVRRDAHGLRSPVSDLHPQLWLISKDTQPSAVHPRDLLSPQELVTAARIQTPADQQRYITARTVLKLLLAWDRQTPVADVVLDTGPFGKPRWNDASGQTRVHFNISHSGDWILIGFHHRWEVGVDIEQIMEIPELPLLAKSLFPPEKWPLWQQKPVTEQRNLFFSHWTLREAGLKAIGCGLTGPAPTDWESGLSTATVVVPDGYTAAAALWLTGV